MHGLVLEMRVVDVFFRIRLDLVGRGFALKGFSVPTPLVEKGG